MINELAIHRLAKLRSSKILWVFLGACVFFGLPTMLPVILFSKVAEGASLGESAAVPFFYFVNLMGHIIALIMGVTTWRQDLRDGTLLTFAARPIARIELLMGKVLGSAYGLLLYLLIAVILYSITHLLFFDFKVPGATALYLVQLLTAWLSTYSLGLLFSNFVSPLMASFLAVVYWLLYLLGNIFRQTPVEVLQSVGDVLKFISIDNDQAYSLQAILMSDLPTVTPILEVIGYYLLWTVFLLILSIILFNRREFIGKRS